MFIQIKNDQPYGYPVVYENMMQVIPNDAPLPTAPLTTDLLQYGFAVYEFAQRPEINPSEFKVVEEGKPVWTEDSIRGKYITQVWNIRNMTTEEKAQAVEEQWFNVRQQRNSLLYMSDWTHTTDAPLNEVQKAEWATYRQSLRDITDQTDPFNIVWPEQPK